MKGGKSVKKFIAMLLVGTVLLSGAVGCGGDTKPAKDKAAPAKDKDTTPPAKDKDAKP